MRDGTDGDDEGTVGDDSCAGLSVRPTLVRVASGTLGSLAVTSRLCLQRDKTASWQVAPERVSPAASNGLPDCNTDAKVVDKGRRNGNAHKE